jgi:probable F420-dependent oxidoreductase
MKIGVFSTFMSPLATPGMIRDFGRHAEDIGLESIWMGEHVALFDKNTFGYPSSKDGRIPVPAGGGMLDVTATFGFLAAVTSKLRFGTGVALVPQRNPIYTAKEMCTLDWLTEGRIDFGIGVGWNKEEVEACGYRWEDRGARCDEFMQVMRRLWTEDVVDFKGKWVQFETMRMDPKPIQKPHIPIIVGGYADAALRRAVRYGTVRAGMVSTATSTRRKTCCNAWTSPLPRPARPAARSSRSSSPRQSRCQSRLWPNTPNWACTVWWSIWAASGRTVWGRVWRKSRHW